jgi:hypothetical protein
MSKCGQYHNATESLSRIIDNYEMQDQQHRLRSGDDLFLKFLPSFVNLDNCLWSIVNNAK